MSDDELDDLEKEILEDNIPTVTKPSGKYIILDDGDEVISTDSEFWYLFFTNQEVMPDEVKRHKKSQ